MFRALDPEAWEASGHDPLALLRMVGPGRLDFLARDSGFISLLTGPRRPPPPPRAHPSSCPRRRADFTEAIEAVRLGTIFTTHTPVSARIDRFSRHLMDWYFG